MSDGSEQKMTNQACGFVSVIGEPNAGKSTFMNAMVGSKVSIVSPKVQTTRTIVRGIGIYDDTQIVFVDTPGIFEPKKRLERAMVKAAWSGGTETDVIILMVDAAKKDHKSTEYILERLLEQKSKAPVILVLNKIDKLAKAVLLDLAQKLNDLYDFETTFMISALKEDGIKDIAEFLCQKMPEGPWMFPEDQVSDMPMRLLAAEVTREKLFLNLHQELPYSVAVETESWEHFDNGSIKIEQVVIVSKDSHKGIVLGKGGKQIKNVGQASRIELEEMLDTQVHLKLFVKVKERWQDDPEQYSIWGLDYSG